MRRKPKLEAGDDFNYDLRKDVNSARGKESVE